MRFVVRVIYGICADGFGKFQNILVIHPGNYGLFVSGVIKRFDELGQIYAATGRVRLLCAYTQDFHSGSIV